MNHYDETIARVTTTQAHWDAMADAIGEAEATALYGERPELVNSATWAAPLYTKPMFADKAPGRALIVVVCLALAVTCSVVYRATHKVERVPVNLGPACVETRESGMVCR